MYIHSANGDCTAACSKPPPPLPSAYLLSVLVLLDITMGLEDTQPLVSDGKQAVPQQHVVIPVQPAVHYETVGTSTAAPPAYNVEVQPHNTTVIHHAPMYQPVVAWIAWFLCFFGFFGIHRCYLGRVCSGCVWFLTAGFCGIGQILDICCMRHMVDDANRRAAHRVVGVHHVHHVNTAPASYHAVVV